MAVAGTAHAQAAHSFYWKPLKPVELMVGPHTLNLGAEGTDTLSFDEDPSQAGSGANWVEAYWPLFAGVLGVAALLTAFLVVHDSAEQPQTVMRFDVK